MTFEISEINRNFISDVSVLFLVLHILRGFLLRILKIKIKRFEELHKGIFVFLKLDSNWQSPNNLIKL